MLFCSLLICLSVPEDPSTGPLVFSAKKTTQQTRIKRNTSRIIIIITWLSSSCRWWTQSEVTKFPWKTRRAHIFHHESYIIDGWGEKNEIDYSHLSNKANLVIIEYEVNVRVVDRYRPELDRVSRRHEISVKSAGCVLTLGKETDPTSFLMIIT
jgi:hypothetical protein